MIFCEIRLTTQLVASLQERCSVQINREDHILNHVISCNFIEKVCKQLISIKKDYPFWIRQK